MRRKIIILSVIIIFGSLITACRTISSDNPNGKVKSESDNKITGGNCIYNDFKGIVTIKEVQPIPGSNSANNNSTEKYKVNFVFTTDAPDAPERVRKFDSEIWLTKQEIEKNQIKTGKQISTAASYQVSGTCAPGPFLDQFKKSLSAENK